MIEKNDGINYRKEWHEKIKSNGNRTKQRKHKLKYIIKESDKSFITISSNFCIKPTAWEMQGIK